MTTEPNSPRILTLTTSVIIAYVRHNNVPTADLPDLISAVAKTLAVPDGSTPALALPPAAKPAITVKKSVTDDWIICLEDGKKFKFLTRHLRETYGMTPADYRRKWNLPADYPMTAPGYSRQRSERAKTSGFWKLAKPAADARKPKPRPTRKEG